MLFVFANPESLTLPPPHAGHRGPVRAVAFDATGNYFASAGDDQQVGPLGIMGAKYLIKFIFIYYYFLFNICIE